MGVSGRKKGIKTDIAARKKLSELALKISVAFFLYIINHPDYLEPFCGLTTACVTRELCARFCGTAPAVGTGLLVYVSSCTIPFPGNYLHHCLSHQCKDHQVGENWLQKKSFSVDVNHANGANL